MSLIKHNHTISRPTAQNMTEYCLLCFGLLFLLFRKIILQRRKTVSPIAVHSFHRSATVATIPCQNAVSNLLRLDLVLASQKLHSLGTAFWLVFWLRFESYCVLAFSLRQSHNRRINGVLCQETQEALGISNYVITHFGQKCRLLHFGFGWQTADWLPRLSVDVVQTFPHSVGIWSTGTCYNYFLKVHK